MNDTQRRDVSGPSPEQVAALLSKYKAIAVRCAKERDEARKQLKAALAEIEYLKRSRSALKAREREHAAFVAGFEAFVGPGGCWDRDKIKRDAREKCKAHFSVTEEQRKS